MNFLKVAIVSLTFFTIQAGAFYVTSRPVEPQVKSLLELVTEDINYRYTDAAKRLTAIKDKDLDSCFVTNYDPQWNLFKTEKESISRRKPFETVKSTRDFVKLRRKAGNIIAHMCKRVKIFWLNQQLPPPLLPGSQGQAGLRPPPLLPINPSKQGQTGLLPPPLLTGNNDNQGQNDLRPPLSLSHNPDQSLLPQSPQLIPGAGDDKGGSQANIPPPALPKQSLVPAGQNQNQAPPLANNKDAAQAPPLLISGNSGNEAQKIATPPPLDLWLQMQHDKKQPPAPPLINGQNEMVEPPQIPNSEIVAPPKIPAGDYIMENGQPRAPRNLINDDLTSSKSTVKMLEPLIPDFKTPPIPEKIAQWLARHQ